MKRILLLLMLRRSGAEQELFKLNDQDFSVVAFRPSTVFGASPALRTDIVIITF